MGQFKFGAVLHVRSSRTDQNTARGKVGKDGGREQRVDVHTDSPGRSEESTV